MLSRLFQISFIACLSALVGTAHAQQDQDKNELEMVYIGASWMQHAANLFSQQAAKDLGVKVNFWQRNTGGQVAIATAKLAAGGQWDIVDDADIIVIMITGNFGRRVGYCLDTPSENPFSEAPEDLREDVEEFLAELDRNVDLTKTMVRIGLPAVKPHFRSQWVERDNVSECSKAWSALLNQWREVAADYRIPVIDVTRAWNGSDATAASPEEYFVWDRTHLNEQGAEAVAALIRAEGYAPLSP
ncbi:SGNH/GDSL hydrolase family protein [Boseongicola aestuarii]|uniref:GDSL-like Lipase/Acylhydrolase n=1 Tax=Boseongicola aestuarii TaxID=1470561 RepID=A0A238J424_9RHOB|nr:SGNH/GDSL hydrolase family protein [Boseongicola aestuarii]SMX25499.1 GDSL-like Lipase/Acylhydrolase [Boseongicola aestuarii]